MPAAGEENAADDPGVRRYRDPDPGPEIALPSGDVTEGVVRVGATVRRPSQPTSLAVAHYLEQVDRVRSPRRALAASTSSARAHLIFDLPTA